MEELFRELAGMVALGVEALVVLLLGFAVAQASWGVVRSAFRRDDMRELRQQVWLRLGLWIVLALEFALAADIIRTAIAPDWQSVGQLAAVAAIRTALNWALGRDIRENDEWWERRRG